MSWRGRPLTRVEAEGRLHLAWRKRHKKGPWRRRCQDALWMAKYYRDHPEMEDPDAAARRRRGRAARKKGLGRQTWLVKRYAFAGAKDRRMIEAADIATGIDVITLGGRPVLGFQSKETDDPALLKDVRDEWNKLVTLSVRSGAAPVLYWRQVGVDRRPSDGKVILFEDDFHAIYKAAQGGPK